LLPEPLVAIMADVRQGIDCTQHALAEKNSSRSNSSS
jgi:hypothetical protein